MIDKDHMIDSIEAFPRWAIQGFDLGKNVTIEGPISRIVVVGMGGSGVGGKILKTYLGEKLHIEAVQGESLPKGVGKETLVFVVSYSGETKETLAAYREAQRRACKIVVITSGGTLGKKAKSDDKAHVIIPGGIPPRAALPYLFFPMLRVLQESGLIPQQRDYVLNMAKNLQNPQYKEKGEDLATELKDRVALIYGSPFLAPVAYRWKTQINENAQAPAFANAFPELCHNEVEGFMNRKVDFHVIMLREQGLSGFVHRLFKATKKLLKSSARVTELVFSEPDPLTQLMSAIYIGDWTSYFLAIKYGTDPSPVPVIKELKRMTSSLIG